MKKLLILAVPAILLLAGCNHPVSVTSVDLPDTTLTNRHYQGNRAPLLNTPFIKLPIGMIETGGWLHKQLELEADGYFGHLGEISKFLVKENNSWLLPEGQGDHGWEELPYWLKGYSNLAYLLDRKGMIDETKTWIEAVFKNQQPDGWFGPGKGRTGAATNQTGREDLWPNMIMLFVLQDYYSWSGDERVIKLMTRYFKYLETIPDNQFLIGYWPANRGGDLLYSIYWLYNRTGDAALLNLAKRVHDKSVDWTDSIPDWHNVNMAQSFGEPTTYYQQAKDPKFEKASERNFEQIRKMYGQVPGGLYAGDENCRPGYTDPRQAVETCGMVEMMLSTEVLFTITGDPRWAGRCEDVAFNSFPAALTADMKALRYLTAPNQPVSDKISKSPGIGNDGPMFEMNPNIHRCCQHNQGQGWPYYAEHQWLATSDNGLAAAFYSQNRVTALVGNGTSVSINENTDYPFEETIQFVVEPEKPVRFPLYFRIPTWCTQPVVRINGVETAYGALADYIRIDKRWMSGDSVSLVLPMKLAVREWSGNKNSVSVDYGPLTFSLDITEKYVPEGGSEKWPAFEIFPESPWNYGLVLDPNDPAKSLELVKRGYPSNDMPFTHEGTPLEVKATGRRIPEWKLDKNNLVEPLPQSPVVSDQPDEPVTLIPMGAARLRISSFPVIRR